MEFVPRKLYYKIGEVCRIVGVEAYVLRYWEREFAALTPPKSKSGQRTYRPRDINLLLQIKKLLYEEGFTIAGARKQLGTGVPAAAQEGSARVSAGRRKQVKQPIADGGSTERLGKVRAELENILTLLNRG